MKKKNDSDPKTNEAPLHKLRIVVGKFSIFLRRVVGKFSIFLRIVVGKFSIFLSGKHSAGFENISFQKF